MVVAAVVVSGVGGRGGVVHATTFGSDDYGGGESLQPKRVPDPPPFSIKANQEQICVGVSNRCVSHEAPRHCTGGFSHAVLPDVGDSTLRHNVSISRLSVLEPS